MRRFKDAGEIAAMNKALRLAEDAFQALRKTIKPGQTEIEIAAHVQYRELFHWFAFSGFVLIVLELLLANTWFRKLP